MTCRLLHVAEDAYQQSRFGTMKLIILLIGFAVVCFAEDHGYGNRPRGAALAKTAFYAEKNEFECLDGSKKIPYDRVNDDYCDCDDGSDEPGTSACPNGKFHCINLGYKSMDVPSSRVNDFICDCCDGSDEWDSGVQCPNVCSQLGAQARKEAEEYKKVVTAGFTKRSELAKEGDKMVKEKTGGIDQLRKELDELQPLKTAVEAKKAEAEEKERVAKEVEDNEWEIKRQGLRRAAAEKLFAKLDVDNDGKLTVEDFKKVPEFDNDHNSEVSEDEAKVYLFGEDSLDLEAFLDKSFDDVRKMLDIQVPEPKTEQIEKEEKDEESEDDSVPPEPEKKQEEWENRPPYSEAVQKVIDEATQVRNEMNEISLKVNDLESKIHEAEQFVEFDYGTDHAWASLKGQCFELTEHQYTYKLCLFDRSTQKDRNGHHEVSLGNWNSWNGPESDKYASQIYDKGQSCWGGPDRSTRVEIKCGEETKLIEATEPAKCEYKFVLVSPAACHDPAKLEEKYHSEL